MTTPCRYDLADRIDQAFDWLCRSRAHWPDGADVWSLRSAWPRQRRDLIRSLSDGTYVFSSQQELRGPGGTVRAIWRARDAVVLKALALYLADALPKSEACTHLKGHGGLKRAVSRVQDALGQHQMVLRTDVRAYYASIDHFQLLDRLARYVPDRAIMALLSQYLRRTVEYGGTFRDVTRGISGRCPLGPLIGAFYLHDLDVAITTRHPRCFYIRYMDDIVIMAPTRWQLRRAIVTLHAHFDARELQMHPAKTWVGRIVRGFEFLGYHHSPSGLCLADDTRERHRAKLTRLYEQLRSCRQKAHADRDGQITGSLRAQGWGQTLQTGRRTRSNLEHAVQVYKARFRSWALGGLKDCLVSVNGL